MLWRMKFIDSSNWYFLERFPEPRWFARPEAHATWCKSRYFSVRNVIVKEKEINLDMLEVDSDFKYFSKWFIQKKKEIVNKSILNMIFFFIAKTKQTNQIDRHVNWVLRFKQNYALTMIALQTCDLFDSSEWQKKTRTKTMKENLSRLNGIFGHPLEQK